MDRYLSKAKRVDNGEWVTGLLKIGFPYDELFYVIQDIDTKVEYPFDAKTLCQCTGLKDKNGVLIFEADKVIIRSDNTTNLEGIVKFDQEKLTWWASIEFGSTYLVDQGYGKNDREVEVVGNKYD